MNRHLVCWKSVGVAMAFAVLGMQAAFAQQEDIDDAVDHVPEVRLPERERLNEVVVIGGNAVVRSNQVASEVVVVRGTALIEGEVDGDVVVVLGEARVTGNVQGSLVVVMGEADVNGEIDRDVALILARGEFGQESRVNGDLVAVGSPPVMHGSVVRGHQEIVSLAPIMPYIDAAKEYVFQGVFLLRPFPPRLGWVWVVAGIFLVFHILVAALFPGALRGCMLVLNDQPARSFLLGLLACVLVGPVSLLLSFTMVATPLIWLAFFALCAFGRIAVYATTGSGMGRVIGLKFLSEPIPALVVGSLLFYLSYMVPVLGYLVYWFVLPWGVGAALICMFDALRRERSPAIGSPVVSSPGHGAYTAAAGLSAGHPGPATHAIVPGPGTPTETSASTDAPPIESPAATPPRPPSPPPPPPPVVPLTGIELAAAPRIGFWPRLAATSIDLIVVGFVNAVTFETFKSFWILVGLYHFLMWTWKGTTLGGAILGIRLIRLDGRQIDWQTSIVRVLGSLVSLLPLGLGFFWVGWDEQYQSWHDRIAGTTIVKADRRTPLV